MQIIKTDHLDNMDNLDILDHLDHHEHLNHLEHLEHLDNLNHLSHPNHPDHPDHLDLNDLPNQVSYNPDHQKIYQEDNYRICIAYFVLFQIILIYVQVLLSITLHHAPPMSIDNSEVLKWKHSFHGHFKKKSIHFF